MIMHISLFAAGLLLSLDSLLVSVPMGVQRMNAAQRWQVALAFAVCDGLASYLSCASGLARWCTSVGPIEWLGPMALGIYGVYMLMVAWQGRRLAAAGFGGWMALGLPLCLSLDNLAAGVGNDASGSATALAALTCGLVSGCLSLVGLRLGAVIASRVHARAEGFAGAALVAFAIVLVWKETLA
jgi:putative Mn2+ efflux pump MntP